MSVHTYPDTQRIQKFPLWRAYTEISGYTERIRRTRVDARCIRIKKFADTKISEYVWTGPKRAITLQREKRLSIASSVDSNQSNPSASLSSFWVSITFLKVESLCIARIHCRFSESILSSALFCKQEEERSRLSRGPHLLNLRSLRTH